MHGHTIASAAQLVPSTLIALVSAYLGAVTLAAWRAVRAGRARTPIAEGATHRFAIVIPAHDEAQLIGETLRSIAKLDYPPTHHTIHVVADNCADDTADIARDLGARVHERSAPDDPGKGPALNWLLDRLADDEFDAVVHIDADTVVSPDLLRVMDARLARGERVVQAYYAVRDPGRSWAVAVRYAALAVRHHLRPLGRTALGGSAGLYGNGMMLAADIVRSRRWTSHLTEDIELEAELLLAGERVTFAADALVEAEMPARLGDGVTQNARWERGRLDVVRRFVPRLLRAAATDPTRRVACADAAVDHLVPPLSLLGLCTASSAVASTLLWLARRTALSRANLAVAVGGGVIQAGYVISGLRMVGAPPTVWRALLRTPVFVLWKVRAWAAMAGADRSGTWIRTARNG